MQDTQPTMANAKRTLAVFDFDGTITTKDSLLEFLFFVFDKSAVWFALPYLAGLKGAAVLHLLSPHKAKQQAFSFFFERMEAAVFDKWGEDFKEEISRFVRPEAIRRIRFHQERGDEVVIISASLEEWIAPWAASMGIHTVLATRAERKEGRLTGRFSTPDCRDREKVIRFKEKFPDREQYILYVYGDSRGDRELLREADQAYYKTFK